MIPAAHLDRWAERQADYMAEIRRRARREQKGQRHG
jgi:hypothetical protein